MENIWYVDELGPTAETLGERTKDVIDDREASNKEIKRQARGLVRVHMPRWERVQDGNLLRSSEACEFYQVRLGFEFDIPQKDRDARIQFLSAVCSALLWTEAVTSAQPRVYDVYPRELYEGEAREVSVELGPELKVGDASATLGKLSTSVRVGHVEPVVVAFLGKEEREPRWELRPAARQLIGVRNLWMLIEAPKASSVRLAVRAEGDIRTKWGPIPVGPKERTMSSRPSVLIR